MRFPISLSLLLAATIGGSAAAVLPRRQWNTTSDSFILHSRALNDSSISLGYVHGEYAYPPGYYAVLSKVRDDAISGYLTDADNVTMSRLEFPETGADDQGFVLGALTKAYPRSMAMINSGERGTKGVYVDEGGQLGWALGGGKVAWYACPHQALEWGTATGLWYKWANVTTPSNCIDIELVAESV